MSDDEINTSDIPLLAEDFFQRAKYECPSTETVEPKSINLRATSTSSLKDDKLMQDEYDFSQGKREAVDPTPPGKTRITIHLDDDVIAWFREQVEQMGSGNYQTTINQALRDHIERQSLEELLRRVVREELQNVD